MHLVCTLLNYSPSGDSPLLTDDIRITSTSARNSWVSATRFSRGKLLYSAFVCSNLTNYKGCRLGLSQGATVGKKTPSQFRALARGSLFHGGYQNCRSFKEHHDLWEENGTPRGALRGSLRGRRETSERCILWLILQYKRSSQRSLQVLSGTLSKTPKPLRTSRACCPYSRCPLIFLRKLACTYLWQFLLLPPPRFSFFFLLHRPHASLPLHLLLPKPPSRNTEANALATPSANYP